jgi:peptidoglycan hydrolase CwlO-like protein
MTLPDEYVIPIFSMTATAVSGAFAWFINQNRQRVDDIEKDIEHIREELNLLEIAVHESKIRRQSDVDIMFNLTKNMEALSEKITELRIEIQNKQTRL